MAIKLVGVWAAADLAVVNCTGGVTATPYELRLPGPGPFWLLDNRGATDIYVRGFTYPRPLGFGTMVGGVNGGPPQWLLETSGYATDALVRAAGYDVVPAGTQRRVGFPTERLDALDLLTLIGGVGTLFVSSLDLPAVAIPATANVSLLATAEKQDALLAATKSAANDSNELNSGARLQQTTDDTAVSAISANGSADYHHVQINNTSSAAGAFSIDGGTTWHYLAASGDAGSAVAWDGVCISNQVVKIKRISGGTNLSGVKVSVW